jgi:hypothetical protein
MMRHYKLATINCVRGGAQLIIGTQARNTPDDDEVTVLIQMWEATYRPGCALDENCIKGLTRLDGKGQNEPTRMTATL